MITFQKAHIDQADKIVSLVNSAYRGPHAKLGWTTEADILDGQRTDHGLIAEMINSSDSEIFLALDENKSLIGCIYVKYEEASLYFGMLTVEPSLQNKGIGKKLLLLVEEIARQKNIVKIRMTVIRGRTELVAYYERFGFKKTGRIEEFPEDSRYGIPKKEKPVLDEFIKNLSE
jgi:ribosomal protein S18 acetylase RimI-like enzyme